MLNAFSYDSVLYLLIAIMLVVGLVRTRRLVFLCVLGALILITLSDNVLSACHLLTRMTQRYVGVTYGTYAFLAGFAKAGWLIALGTAIAHVAYEKSLWFRRV